MLILNKRLATTKTLNNASFTTSLDCVILLILKCFNAAKNPAKDVNCQELGSMQHIRRYFK